MQGRELEALIAFVVVRLPGSADGVCGNVLVIAIVPVIGS